MRHDNIHPGTASHKLLNAEPEFDVPPRIAPRAEQRLALRAAARWSAHQHRSARPGGTNLPGLDSIDLDPGGEFAAHGVLLDLRGDAMTLLTVGSGIATTFGLTTGPLLVLAPDGLAARLREACDLLRLTEAAVPVEGALAGTDCACLLTRGVLMPIGDVHGRLGYAHGVFSWKQVLDARTSAALRRELVDVMMTPARSGHRTPF